MCTSGAYLVVPYVMHRYGNLICTPYARYGYLCKAVDGADMMKCGGVCVPLADIFGAIARVECVRKMRSDKVQNFV